MNINQFRALAMLGPGGSTVPPIRAGRADSVVIVVIALGALFSACSNSPTAPSTPSITITGTVPAVGQTSQLTAKTTLSNGTTQDVTAQATWSSSNTTVATVTSGGLLNVLQPGSATITATYQNHNGTFSVNLQVTSVTVTGPNSMLQGSNWQLSAIANFSNGTTQFVTNQAVFASTNTAVLRIGTINGVVTSSDSCGHIPEDPEGYYCPALGTGVADITATYQNVTGRLSITVKPPTCQFTLGGDTLTSAPGTFSTPYLSVNGFTVTFTITMTSGGSGCRWSVIILQPLFPSDLKVVSQGGTVNGDVYDGDVYADGTGNGTIFVTMPANHTGGDRSAAIVIHSSEVPNEGGQGVYGTNHFVGRINQSGR